MTCSTISTVTPVAHQFDAGLRLDRREAREHFVEQQ